MSEIQSIINQLIETYEGDPWFGRNVKAIMFEVDEHIAFEKPNYQHSILELVWHMVTWREFTISRLKADNTKELSYFEENDWRKLDHTDKTLWQQALQSLDETHHELVELLLKKNGEFLNEVVAEKIQFQKIIARYCST